MYVKVSVAIKMTYFIDGRGRTITLHNFPYEVFDRGLSSNELQQMLDNFRAENTHIIGSNLYITYNEGKVIS